MCKHCCSYVLLLVTLLWGITPASASTAAGAETGISVIDIQHQPTATPPPPEAGKPRLKVAVGPMLSPRDTFVMYHRLLVYMGKKLGYTVEFIQRKTHAEVNELLRGGDIDLAFVCAGPYAIGKESHGLELIAMPEVQGKRIYYSYIIVHADSAAQSLADLQGASFAFTDPDSNTGYLTPRYQLAESGHTPESFFSKTMFTHSHDNSILAVARGLVSGASVNSLIWDYYSRTQPELTRKTRVIRHSKPYAIPPVVASALLNPELRAKARAVLLNLHHDTEGIKLLQELGIDRFVVPDDAWYAGIRQMHESMGNTPKSSHGPTVP